jgi:hypothetical protein
MRRKKRPLRRSSFLQRRIPVCDEREGDGALWGIGFRHQKALAIGCHVKEVKGLPIDRPYLAALRIVCGVPSDIESGFSSTLTATMLFHVP